MFPYSDLCVEQPTRIAPVGAPQNIGLPLEWEDFYYP